MSNIKNALYFAKKAHEGQVRKYTGEPYVNHCVAVSTLVSNYFNDDNMVMAALLHDTVEDTYITIENIQKQFGDDVASLVSDLTDVSRPEHGNREARKALDRQHTFNSSDRAKNIKLCDLIDNCKSIIEHDKNFAKIYLKEKKLLLDGLKADTNAILWHEAKAVYDDAMKELEGWM